MSMAIDKQRSLGPFGADFASNMAITWFRDGSWETPRVKPLENLSLHPGAHVLHYASTSFEGMKAYRGADGQIRIFRLDRHAERMRKSLDIICLPQIGVERFKQMVLDLVAVCRDEVPEPPAALYIRPTMIGTEPNIGKAAAPTQEACFYVLVSPVGDYFAGGGKALKVLIEDEQGRTVDGLGECKTGVNYAAALRHIQKARAAYEGVDQVLFCPNGDVQETGASNFMLINDKKLITKALDDSFLHGVTRDSLLTIAQDLGYEVEERNISVDELKSWVKTGEAALSGTAAVLAGVGAFIHKGEEIPVRNGAGTGPNTQRLRDALTAIQIGSGEDKHGWLTSV